MATTGIRSLGSTWITELFEEVDALDAAAFAGRFSDDGVFRFANQAAAVGRAQIEEASAAFFSTIGGLRHEVTGIWSGAWEGGDVKSVESSVTYTRSDGTVTPALPATSTIRMRGELIEDFRVFVDLTPVFTPEAGPSEPFGYQAGEGRRVWIVGDTLTFKASAEQTGGSMTAVEVLAAPGGGPPPHVHANEDEAFYVLEGEFEILNGDELMRATAGAFAFVPRGTLHRFENVGDAPGRMLIVYTPGGFEGFFFEAGLPVVEGETPPPLGADEIDRSREAAIRYGMDVRWPGEGGPS